MPFTITNIVGDLVVGVRKKVRTVHPVLAFLLAQVAWVVLPITRDSEMRRSPDAPRVGDS
jgi:hypothetical protein